MYLIQQNIVACITAICGGVLSAIFGLSPMMLMLLVGIMMVDLFSGIRAAQYRGEKIKSKRMRDKFWHLLETGVLLLTITLLIRASLEVGVPIDSAKVIYNSAFIFIFLPEAYSVFENYKSMGWQIPEWMFTILDKISLTNKKK